MKNGIFLCDFFEVSQLWKKRFIAIGFVFLSVKVNNSELNEIMLLVGKYDEI